MSAAKNKRKTPDVVQEEDGGEPANKDRPGCFNCGSSEADSWDSESTKYFCKECFTALRYHPEMRPFIQRAVNPTLGLSPDETAIPSRMKRAGCEWCSEKKHGAIFCWRCWSRYADKSLFYQMSSASLDEKKQAVLEPTPEELHPRSLAEEVRARAIPEGHRRSHRVYAGPPEPEPEDEDKEIMGCHPPDDDDKVLDPAPAPEPKEKKKKKAVVPKTKKQKPLTPVRWTIRLQRESKLNLELMVENKESISGKEIKHYIQFFTGFPASRRSQVEKLYKGFFLPQQAKPAAIEIKVKKAKVTDDFREHTHIMELSCPWLEELYCKLYRTVPCSESQQVTSGKFKPAFLVVSSAPTSDSFYALDKQTLTVPITNFKITS